jgi:hypothetical protein
VSCDPERVTGWVDGALPRDEMDAIAAHVAACPECAQQAAEERALRARLASLPAAAVPSGLAHRARETLRRRSGVPLWRLALPVAASFIVAVLLLRMLPPVVALELARDHRHCFGFAQLPAQVWTNDGMRAISWFEKQGTPMPMLPDAAGGLELVGARYCGLPDQSRVAHLYYRGKGRRDADSGEPRDLRLSLYVVQHRVHLSGVYERVVTGETVRLARVGTSTVALVSESADAVDAFERALSHTVADLD